MTDEELRDAYAASLARREVDPARASCASPEAMQAVVEDRASEEEREGTIDHVMACPACRRDFEALRAVARAGERLVASESAPTTPATAPAGAAPAGAAAGARRGRWGSRRPMLAAAAAVMVMAGAGLVLQRQRAGGDGDDGAPPAAAEPMRGADADAVLTVGPAGTVARPAGGGGGGSASVALVWRAVPGATRYVAELLDESGTPRFAAETADTTLALPDSVRLTPGAAYQWWVRARLADGGERRSRMQRFELRD